MRWAWELPAVVVLLAVATTSAGVTPAAVPLAALAAVTPALCVIDVREHRLPNRIVLPCYAACAVGLVGEWADSGHPPILALVAGVATGGFLFVLSLAGGIGMGDVKLGGVLGFAAGGIGLDTAVLAPLLGFVLGGAAAIAALRGGRGARFPFGPALLGGFWAAVVLSAV